jgi:alpha-amylase/alpha-mannosidase (GH57 family)
MINEAERLKIVFLWHMHQPFYKDYFSGEYILPWVRLHGLKDYLDMAAILDDYPKIKQTFNYVPSLVKQLMDYIENDAVDRHLYLSRKKPDELTEAEKLEILKTFFSANYETMIKPYPKYNRLFQNRKYYLDDLPRAVNNFSDQDYLDLTVLSNLVWIDPVFRNHPDIKPLYGKKKPFTLEDRDKLLIFQKGILKQILPKHKEIQDRGQIEVSFSPFYHPILPLLIDSELAKEAMPRIRLPENRFTHPEDAKKQIEKSIELYADIFGRNLRGMWPSEGSVAEKLLPILAECGIEWIATDEEIFFQSINHPKSKPECAACGLDFHQPFVLKRPFGEIGIIFRDHRLSDRIGFVYSTWDADKAAADFINHLASIRALLKPSEIEDHAVPIILDGENAWEYFANDGIDFLNSLYKRLSNDDRFETVTVSELYEKTGLHKNIPYLFAGSWISHNFKIWIGHEEDNRAWDLLWAARTALVEYQDKNPRADLKKMEQAWEEIYIAEGSDWCWWYGDEHSSQEDDIFDIIFRSHLSAVYSLIGQDPPRGLLEPVRSTVSQSAVIQPSNFFSATIDGEVTHFYEWYDAGSFNCRKASSTMHRAANVVEEIFFGFDKDNLFYRLDLFTTARDEGISDFDFELEIHAAKIYYLRISHAEVDFGVREKANGKYAKLEFGGKVVLKKCAEISIPRRQIEMNKDFYLNLRVRVYKAGQLVETWPSLDLIKYQAPTEDQSIFWQV